MGEVMSLSARPKRGGLIRPRKTGNLTKEGLIRP
jgi:hypothetical protein